MTDVLDRRIRGLVAELVDAAPVAPPLDPFGSPGRRRSRSRSVAGAAVAACLVVVTALLVVVDEEHGSRVELGRPPTETPAAETAAKPTFVVPSQLPSGFELVAAGSDTTRRMGTQEIVFWSEDFTRSGGIVWSGPDGRCPPAAIPRWAGAASQQEAINAYRSDAAKTGPPENLAWCDPIDDVLVSVTPRRGLSTEEVADVAEGVVRNGEELAVRLPAGFTAVRTPEDRDLIRLLYRGPGGIELWVDVSSAGPFPLERQRVNSQDPASWETAVVGGRPAIKGDHLVAVLYDEHTLAVLSSPAIGQSDLLTAAASLVPGDPRLPKPVASDPSLCDRLGMCG